MPLKKVKHAIDELNVELKNTSKETSVLEKTLKQAKDGLEDYTPEAVQDLLETLERIADEFEVEHPRVTALVNQLATTLAGMGI
jgi:uncharacterized protein YqeY